MKVLLVNSYFLKLDPKQHRIMNPYPPLATIYAASIMREKGHDLFFHDVTFDSSTERVINKLYAVKPDIFVICDDGFNYLTKMCLSNMRAECIKMLNAAKGLSIVSVVSSSDATDHSELYLEGGADYIVAGEAELTLVELLQAIQFKNEVEHICGLIYKVGQEIHKTLARQVLNDLDALPIPAFDLINWNNYKDKWLTKHGYFSVNMVTTRGCPYKCNWCAKPIYGNRYNAHSPHYIIRVIEEIARHVNYDHIWFADDIFGLKPNWVKTFSELLLEKKIKIAYKIQSRADLLLSEDYVQSLSLSGCETVWMGAESGSQKVLDSMDKGITIDEIVRANQLLKLEKIKTAFFIQIGYPGEDLSDIQLTIRLIEQAIPDDIGISVSYPLPGTPFYERVKHELRGKSNWTDSDDMDLMFYQKYPKEFYKTLQKYIHYNYRTFQSKANKRMFSKSGIKLPYYAFKRKQLKNRLNELLKNDGERI